jgi:DNA modification methylase
MHSSFDLHHGDCLDILRTMPDNSIDAVVTDPPYGLAFMGKKWDYDVPSEDIWRECLRVLKPGGHLLAFAGTRTQHRMAVRIEDAGFEIRDMIAWVYGSGFPKSLDVSKAIDRQRHDREQVYEVTAWIRAARDAAGLGNADIDKAFGCNGMGRHWTDVPPNGKQPAVPTLEQIPQLLEVLGLRLDDVPDNIRDLIWTLNGNKGQPGENWAKREVVGQQAATRLAVEPGQDNDRSNTTLAITAPATPEAQQWAGWGTALKPALEPITVARKPFPGTVANNVLTWGTGAVNVDGCRVGTDDNLNGGAYAINGLERTDAWGANNGFRRNQGLEYVQPSGRWPANLIHDGSEDVVGLFPANVKGGTWNRTAGARHFNNDGDPTGYQTNGSDSSSGSAARFFYCAKASKADRAHGNNHPTVKPTDLMRYLCRLVTPPGGVVLDPFMGSGSTGKAAILEGFRFVGIEREAEYIDISRARIQHAVQKISTQPALDL